MANAPAYGAAGRNGPAFRQPLVTADGDGDDTLARKLGAFDVTLLGIGASIGAGIFVILGTAAPAAGPAVCLSFLFSALGCMFSAFCYAELSARIPQSGSAYTYASTVFGQFAAVLFGVNLLLDYHVGAALTGLACGEYLRSLAGGGAGVPEAWAIAVVVLAAITLLLCFDVASALRKANGLLVGGKIMIVLVIIAAGMLKMQAKNLTPFFPMGIGPVLSTSALTSFSYVGFDVVANTAEECKDPGRDMPIGILASLSACACLYALFSLAICGVVPFADLGRSEPVILAFGPGYADLPWVAQLVHYGSVLGVSTCLLAGLYSQARVYLAMSRDGLLTRHLGYISSRGIPLIAQLMCGSIAALLAATLPLERLTVFLNIGVLASYTMVCSGVLVMRAADTTHCATSCASCAAVSIVASLLAMNMHSALGILAPAWLKALAYAALLAVVFVLGWWPLLRCSYTLPTTFACPYSPIVPLLGITTNGFMLSQCNWEAWVRFAAVGVLTLGGHMLTSTTASSALASPTAVCSVSA